MMASYSSQMNNNFFQPSQLTSDTHKFYDEDDEVLDEDILGPHSTMDSSLDMSPSMDTSRRDSYAVSTSNIFSPEAQEWQPVDVHCSTAASNPFSDHHSTHFMNAQNTSIFGQQNQWGVDGGSGSQTPMQGYDGLPADIEGSGSTTFSLKAMQGQTPFGNTGNQVHLFSPPSLNNASIPNSPQKDWGLAVESMEHRSMSKRMRQNSPGLRSHSPLMRRDGIRKKNARFDIPAERNLQNIDHLIAESVDEQEIKELKQQKRLLRNRQAALDSRQRKKQHTERLEVEKKQYTNLVQDLENENNDYKERVQDLLYRLEQYEHHANQLQLEREELIRAHTQETNDLRKKVNVLTNSVQHLENTAMSTVPSSTGFALSDFDSLTMDTWDFFGSDSDVKVERPMALPIEKHEIPSAPAAESDKSPAQGILLMILLFGAFVATRGQSSGIPRMSDDVRAASATLLEDVFKDAGVSSATASNVVTAPAPVHSISANHDNSWASTSAAQIHHNDLSSFGSYADSLSMPSAEQKHEQLFGLSAAQYNAVSSPTFLSNHQHINDEVSNLPISQGRRNIAETLEAMRRKDKDKSAAEVYTRSLLWDQVPQDVVRNFAKMVEEQERCD